MATSTEESEVFSGYRVPVRNEALGEKDFKKILALEHKGLLLLGRQFLIFKGPEKLDLLAIDGEGIPWIFEFKRDIARPSAIGQLLTYGAYIAGLEYDQLNELFITSPDGRKSKTATLAEAFAAHFRKPLPKIPHQVCLVLVAFEFSVACERLIRFMKRACDLQIGRLKMEWIEHTGAPSKKNYRYLELPWPTSNEGHGWPDYKGGTDRNFLLSTEFYEDQPAWEYCRNSNLLFLPDLEELSNTGGHGFWEENSFGEAYHDLPKSRRYQDLTPGMGLFVHAKVLGCREDPEDEYSEPAFWTAGLIGFGVLQSKPFCAHDRDLDELEEKLGWPHEYFHTTWDRNPWMVHVDWVRTLPGRDAADPNREWPPGTWLREIHKEENVVAFLNALGLQDFAERQILHPF